MLRPEERIGQAAQSRREVDRVTMTIAQLLQTLEGTGWKRKELGMVVLTGNEMFEVSRAIQIGNSIVIIPGEKCQ